MAQRVLPSVAALGPRAGEKTSVTFCGGRVPARNKSQRSKENSFRKHLTGCHSQSLAEKIIKKKEFPKSSTYFQIQQTFLATIKRRQVWTFSNGFRSAEIVPRPKQHCTFEGKICVCLKMRDY